jgi:hypothetical protein
MADFSSLGSMSGVVWCRVHTYREYREYCSGRSSIVQRCAVDVLRMCCGCSVDVLWMRCNMLWMCCGCVVDVLNGSQRPGWSFRAVRVSIGDPLSRGRGADCLKREDQDRARPERVRVKAKKWRAVYMYVRRDAVEVWVCCVVVSGWVCVCP